MLLTSAPARVVKQGERYHVTGMAWGGPVSRVEVQVDGGEWFPARLDSQKGEFAWRFWSADWPNAIPGEHSIASRAFDKKRQHAAPRKRSVACRQKDLLGKQRTSHPTHSHRLN